MTLIVRGPPDKIQVLMTGLEDRGRQNPAVTVIETTIGAARQSFGATIIGDQSDALPMIGETRTNTLIRATATPPSIHLLEIAITRNLITETAVVETSIDIDQKRHRPSAGATGLPRMIEVETMTIATNVTAAKGSGE